MLFRSLQMPQMMAAHDHPDPNAAQSMSLIGAGSWGMQNAAITCYGLFLYLAGRLGLASGKFAKWASYVAIVVLRNSLSMRSGNAGL